MNFNNEWNDLDEKKPLKGVIGGRGEIRTHGGLAPTTVFKTVALNRSATLTIYFRTFNSYITITNSRKTAL
jgi:hypothetical protein